MWVLSAAAAMFALLAVCAALRMGFWSYGADAGTFAQAILDAFHGMRNGIEQGTHYRFHWSPALVLLWPVLALAPGVLTLQLIQALAVVAVAPLVYLLAAPRTTPRAAAFLALLSLVYPPLLAVAFDEFHELGLAPVLIVGAVVAADRRRWAWFFACVVLLATLREDLCVELIVIGVGLGIVRWRAAAAWYGAAAIAAASLAVYYMLVIPRVGPWNPSHFYTYPFADGPLALLVAPLTALPAFVREFATRDRLGYLLEVFVPLAFLPLRTPWVLAAVPGLALVLLANDPFVHHMGTHYSALWAPWLIVATVFATRDARWPAAALVLSVLVLLFVNPMHPGHFLKPAYHALADARRALACVPPRASVATHDEWYTQIAAANPNATLQTLDGVQYLTFAEDFPNAEFRRAWLPRIRAGVLAGRFAERCRFGQVVTYAVRSPRTP
jgi:uncharacterized membrane protein